MKGNFAVAGLLLRRGADPDLQVREGWTPLHISVFNGHLRLSCLLLKHGADPEIQDDSSETPLDIIKYGKIDFISELLESLNIYCSDRL